jgi:Pyruvate/2-oxoacid:ferredoxin oxidoreductase delta subunit
MCEFCTQHGEGEKWYLQAKNYADDLLADVRRRRFIEKFFADTDAISREVHSLENLEKLPRFLRNIIARRVTRKMKKVHFGQVVPLEEIEKIFGFVNSIVRVACICRHTVLGQEKRYCYGVSLGPDGGKIAEIVQGLDQSFINGPHTQGLERLTREEAIAAFHDHEKEGLCHSVWTFHTPFIGGICNCDRSDCLALKTTVSQGVPVMFRAEYVAAIDPEKCVGCRECMRLCQFGALSYSAANKKAGVEQRWCYGCGVCRAACKTEAIQLVDRRQVPLAANLW